MWGGEKHDPLKTAAWETVPTQAEQKEHRLLGSSGDGACTSSQVSWSCLVHVGIVGLVQVSLHQAPLSHSRTQSRWSFLDKWESNHISRFKLTSDKGILKRLM